MEKWVWIMEGLPGMMFKEQICDENPKKCIKNFERF